MPHLQTPLVHRSDVPEQASTSAAHLHRLFVASQNDPVALPSQLGIALHLHDPDWQVSPSILQAMPPPHVHMLMTHSSVVPLHAGVSEEHLQREFVSSQTDPDN